MKPELSLKTDSFSVLHGHSVAGLSWLDLRGDGYTLGGFHLTATAEVLYTAERLGSFNGRQSWARVTLLVAAACARQHYGLSTAWTAAANGERSDQPSRRLESGAAFAVMEPAPTGTGTVYV